MSRCWKSKNLTLDGFFEDVSFTLRAGEIIGITGLLDSGRSELALSLFGIRPASSGDILVKGKKAAIKNPQDAVKLKIGLVPEDRLSEGLFLPQSIQDNVIISEIDKLTTSLGLFDRAKREMRSGAW